MHPRRIHPLFLLGVMQLAACGAGNNNGFSLLFHDNRPSEAQLVSQTIENAQRPSLEPTVVVLPPPPARGLTVYSITSGRKLWQSGTAIDVRPTIAGGVVFAHAEGSALGWSLNDGAERVRIALEPGYTLVGAGGDANAVALSTGPGGINHRRGTFYVVNPQTGRILLQRETDQPLGVPTAIGNYAFVPWSGQNISVFDIRDGVEYTRVRSSNDVVSRVDLEENTVYFGARALYRFDRDAAMGTREASKAFTLPRNDLPGAPPIFLDGYAPVAPGVNARERVTVAMRPDPSRPGTSLVDNTVYSLFHKIVFALDATTGDVRWAASHDADFTGTEVVRGGLVTVDDTGHIVMFDASNGQVVWSTALGEAVSQAVLQLPLDFSPPRSPEGTVPSQAQSLMQAAGGSDNRMLPARIFAAKLLGRVPGAEATRGLVDIASRTTYPMDLRRAAGEALAQRTDGLDVLLDSLRSHFDYLHDQAAPPVGYIARAFATAKDPRAVPALVSHLSDPETPYTDLVPLVRSLRELKSPLALPALLDFVRTYHSDIGLVPPIGEGDLVNDRSDAEQNAITEAVTIAVGAIAELGNAYEQRWLEAIRQDENTEGALKTAIQEALAARATAASTPNNTASGNGNTTNSTNGSNGSDTSNGNTDAQPNTSSNPDSMTFALPPVSLSQAMINATFDPVRDNLLACARGPRPRQLRVQFRYDGTGTISTVVVTPSTYTACMTPIVQAVILPTSQVRVEIGTYYLLGGAL